MNCPNVPVGVVLYVRLDATVWNAVFAVVPSVVDDDVVDVEVRGRISSVPVAPPPSAPMPKKLARMSSRAIVAPGSTWIVVDCPDCVPSVPVSVKLSRYFIACAETLAMRRSDSKSELFAPAAWPTAGTISDSGSGPFLPAGVTGVTRLMETGTLPDDAFALPAAPYVTMIVPV